MEVPGGLDDLGELDGLLDDLVYRGHFTTTWSRGAPVKEVSAALLCACDHVVAVARMRKGSIVTTFHRRLIFDRLLEIDPVSTQQVLDMIDSRVARHARAAFLNGGPIPPKTWARIYDILVRIRPVVADHIRTLKLDRPRWLLEPNSTATKVATLEKDACGVALEIAEVGREALEVWAPPTAPAPFLAGIQSADLSEDQIIQNDMDVFGDWTVLQRYSVGAVTFQKDRRRVTVMNVNRERLEETLGVDLVYYNHDFNAYFMVQYKRFTEESQDSTRIRLVYRPSRDSGFSSQMKRMECVERKLTGRVATLRDYRLAVSPCFIKFCVPRTDPFDRRLVKGMYLPFSYLDLYLKSQEARGPRGGIVISYDHMERYLDNTQFIKLGQNGWIGSRSVASDVITSVIKQLLRDKRSIILATGRKWC